MFSLEGHSGNRYVWHGFPDMLVKHTAVSLLPEKDRDIRGSGQEEEVQEDHTAAELVNYVEAKPQDRSLYDYKFSKQATAQAIVNGYAQQANSKTYKGFVPSVGCTLTYVIIFLYDPEKDILLRRRKQMPLLVRNRELKVSTIVELWFFLNLHLFGYELNNALCAKLQKSSVKDIFEKEDVLKFYKDSVVGAERKELVANATDDLDPSNLSVTFFEARFSSELDDIIVAFESLSSGSD